MLIPTTMDHYPADLSCDQDDSPADMWCNTEQELAALRSFVSVVLSSGCVDECLPLSEPLDDLCSFSSRNLRILKEALEEPGAIGGHNTYFEGDTRSTEISFVSPDCKRWIETFEEPHELAREGITYGLEVHGMSAEAFELLCDFFRSSIFNFEGDARGWKNVDGAQSEVTGPDGDVIRLRVAGNDIQIETSDLLIVLEDGLPGYTRSYRIVDQATGNERQVIQTDIGTRAQVSSRIIADCLATGQSMHYHWIAPVLELAEEHRSRKTYPQISQIHTD
jgi:hypothetical protein